MSVTKELRAKLEAATPGPWEDCGDGSIDAAAGGCVAHIAQHTNINTIWRRGEGYSMADAALIVSAINALPALLAVVEAALERDGCSEVCSAMKPYRGCTCGAEALDRALASLTRNDEVDRVR